MNSPVALYLRLRTPAGKWQYAKPALSSDGRVRPLFALLNGKPVHCPGASYHLRFTIDSRRVWENVGNDASLVTVSLQRKTLELQGRALGFSIPDLLTAPMHVIDAEEAPNPHARRRSLAECISSYLSETKEHKAQRTYTAYKETLELLVQANKRQHIEDITRDDLLAYVAFLRRRGNAPRTIANRVDYLHIFLHHFGLPSLLTGKDKPKYTDKKVRADRGEELSAMLKVASQDESDLLYFLLCTGSREREAAYVCWADVDLEAKTYTVTEHLDLGFGRRTEKKEPFRFRICWLISCG